MKYRKKPIIIDAISPDDIIDMGELSRFCGLHWSRADARDMPSHDEEQVVVYNKLEKQWLVVPMGHWIIRGINGELYPCDPEVFEATYEQVG